MEVDILIALLATREETEKVSVVESDEIIQEVRLAAGSLTVAEDWQNPINEKSFKVVPPA